MYRHRDRKERWLHTRISEPLEEALKREARRRRLPVSLLVRQVLEGALDLVEEIVETSLGAATAAQRAASRRPAPDVSDVYGWQELILGRAGACARCGTGLAVGATAFRGLREQSGPPIFSCNACVRRLGRPAADQGGSPR